jgi:hypothetical protein
VGTIEDIDRERLHARSVSFDREEVTFRLERLSHGCNVQDVPMLPTYDWKSQLRRIAGAIVVLLLISLGVTALFGANAKSALQEKYRRLSVASLL